MRLSFLRTACLCLSLGFLLRAAEAVVPGFTQILRSGRTTFRTYGPDEGLSSLGINQLAQDRDGYLWLGTDIGLFRWDGHRFLQVSRKHGLPSDTVDYLWADPKGGLWANAGEAFCHVAGTQVRRMDGSNGLPHSGLLSLTRDGAGRLWLALGRNGLYREERPGRFAKVAGSPRPWAVAWAPRHGGTFVFGPQDRLDFYQGDALTRSWNRQEGLGLEPIAALEDGQGRLWVLDKHGLSYKPLAESHFHPFSHPVVATGGQVRTLAPDGQGGLWIATVAGLLHIREDAFEVLGASTGLPTQSASTALVDREGSLWYAFGGLHRQLGFGAWTNQTVADGLPTELVWSIRRDARGRLWAGTERGLAVLEGTRWRAVPGTQGLTAFSLIPNADGSLFASGTGMDIFQVDPAGRNARAHRLPGLDPLKVAGIRMLRTRAGQFWAAAGDELLRVGLRNGALAVEEHAAPPVGVRISAESFLEDQEGGIWLAGRSGLFEFREGRWTRFGVKEGLLGESLSGLVVTGDGHFLLAYQDVLGLTRFSRDANGIRILRHYRQETGDLPTDAVFSVHLGREGQVWLNTNIGAVLLQERGYATFGRASGLPNQDMVQGAFWDDGPGGTWFGSSGGLVHFDGSRHPWALPLPRPSLSSIRFGAREVSTGQGPLRIQPRDNTFETQLGCLSYSREKAFWYEARLDGLEPDWHAEDSAQVRYTALPPGRYQFQVRAVLDGRAGPVSALDFEVLPRWYQTLLFRLLAGFSIVPLVWCFSTWRTRRLRAQNERLEAVVSARTLQLEEANLLLKDQMLHDPLTGLYNRRFLTLTLPEQMARIVRDLEAALADPQRSFLGAHPMAFFLLDVDHFKRVNDEHGHDAGDQVLVELAERFREVTRDSDTVVRWGGEEFLLVARQLGASDPSTLAERLRVAVASRPFVLIGGKELHLTISIGFCPFPLGNCLPTMAWDKAVMLADRALYAAKRTGRNRWIGLDAGPAFDAEELAAYAGHPDIPGLLARKLLHGVSQHDEVPDSAWL